MSDGPEREPQPDPLVDWPVIGVAAAGLGWAGWHYWSVTSHPWDEPEAALLIEPLVIGLALTAPFVIRSAVRPGRANLAAEPGAGLGAPNRLLFVLSLPALVLLVWSLGFVLAALLYVPALCLAMGERRPLVLLGLGGGLAALAFFGFREALGVDLPIIPRFWDG